MKVQIFKIAITTISLTLLLFFGNVIFLENTDYSANFELYKFPLVITYLVFLLFSISILITLLIVNHKNKDIVGMTFMLITTFKTAVCYFIFSNVISSDNENTIERINFVIVFSVFLTMETLITIQLLNKKQQ